MKYIKLAQTAEEMAIITSQDTTLPLVAMQKGINKIYSQSSDKLDIIINQIAGEDKGEQTEETNYVEQIDKILGETL